MNTNIKKLTPQGSCGVNVVISDKNWLESSAIEQLNNTARLAGMQQVVGLPDLHPGKGNPIGAAFVSQGCIYPHLVGGDIGCGMGLWELNCKPKKIRIDRWMDNLVGLDEIYEPDHQGVYPIDDEGISQKFSYDLHKKIGTIGGGNHFAEIQKIEKIYSEEGVKALNLEKASVVLLVHSGSRGIGGAVLQQHIEKHGANLLQEGSAEFENYLALHNYAIRLAECNRKLIAQRFLSKLRLQGNKILDITHNFVENLKSNLKENIESENRLWIHRKGATPANRGYVVIPGSRGSLSYIVKPIASEQNLTDSGFSLAHGAGRKWKRADCKNRLTKRFKRSDFLTTELGSRVICADKDLLYEEAPQAYKKIDQVVMDLVDADLVELVACLKPIISYKTRRSS